MRRNWLFVPAMSAMFMSMMTGITQLTPLLAQDNSANETRDDERVYKIANGVTNPRPTYQPMPEYDQDSRKKRVQGTVVLSIIVTKEGGTRRITVEQSLSPNLDAQAIKAVSQWRFSPATKDGEPVAVKMNVEVSFHL